jgi:hypothetical protein
MIFWKLWTLFVAILTGLGAAWYYGYIDYVLANDVTRLSVVILGLFLSASAWVGVLAVKGKQPTKMLWFIAGACTKLGLLGTVGGLMIMMSANFSDIGNPDVNVIEGVITAMISGMGTAMLTTLIGIMAAMLLEMQLVLLSGDNAEN